MTAEARRPDSSGRWRAAVAPAGPLIFAVRALQPRRRPRAPRLPPGGTISAVAVRQNNIRGLLTPVFRGTILLPLAIALTLSSRQGADRQPAVEMYRSWRGLSWRRRRRTTSNDREKPPLDFTNCRLAPRNLMPIGRSSSASAGPRRDSEMPGSPNCRHPGGRDRGVARPLPARVAAGNLGFRRCSAGLSKTRSCSRRWSRTGVYVRACASRQVTASKQAGAARWSHLPAGPCWSRDAPRCGRPHHRRKSCSTRARQSGGRR